MILVLLLSIIKMSGGSQMICESGESGSLSQPSGTYRTFYGKDSVYDLSSDDGAGDCDSAVMWNADI